LVRIFVGLLEDGELCHKAVTRVTKRLSISQEQWRIQWGIPDAP